MTDYKELCEDVRAYTEGVPHLIANLANASALLWQRLSEINWAGFYLMENGILVLGPFQGKPACIEIEVGKGVCGTAVERNRQDWKPLSACWRIHCFEDHSENPQFL